MKLPQHARIGPLTIKSLLAHKPPDVYSVAVDATLVDALRVMAAHDVGALLVLDDQRVLGTFSERDYARWALLGAGRADATPVREVMRACEVFTTPPQAVHECLTLMSEKQLQHIAVLDNGKLLGLLSIGDLLKAIIVQYERVFQASELDQRILFLQGTYSC
jgi:CBS domain-containing protein